MMPNGRENTGLPLAPMIPNGRENAGFPSAFSPAFAVRLPRSGRSGRVGRLDGITYAELEKHIAQQRERVDKIKLQQQAKSDETLHEAVLNAVASQHFPDDNRTFELLTSKLTPLFRLFLDAQNVDAVLGDLLEKHALIAKRSKAEANRTFWRQFWDSLRPLAWAQCKKSFGVNALVKMWRKIRS